MKQSDQFRQLNCSNCGHTTLCGSGEMVHRLRGIGKLKRNRKPDMELILELFSTSVDQFACSECGTIGLTASAADDFFDDEQWGESRKCEICGQSIAAERLEVFPDTRVCISCKQTDESGDTAEEPEYCPRCGALMVLRTSTTAGVVRYEMRCSECRMS